MCTDGWLDSQGHSTRASLGSNKDLWGYFSKFIFSKLCRGGKESKGLCAFFRQPQSVIPAGCDHGSPAIQTSWSQSSGSKWVQEVQTTPIPSSGCKRGDLLCRYCWWMEIKRINLSTIEASKDQSWYSHQHPPHQHQCFLSLWTHYYLPLVLFLECCAF